MHTFLGICLLVQFVINILFIPSNAREHGTGVTTLALIVVSPLFVTELIAAGYFLGWWSL